LPLGLFVAVRALLLCTSLDLLGHLDEAEVFHANLAIDLAEDRELQSLWSYQVVEFHGGTLLSTVLFVPWSWLFGAGYLSLKAMAAAYALATMLLWMALLARWKGPRAAWIFGVLFAAAPPVLLKQQLTLWSTHAESSALQALALVCLAAWLLSHRPAAAFATGLALGAALSFNTINAVFAALAAPVMAWQLAVSARRRIEAPLLLAGGVLGLIPLLAILGIGAGEMAIYGEGPLGLLAGLGGRLLRLPWLLLTVPPLSPQVPPGGVATAVGAVFHVALYAAAGGLAVLAWREEDGGRKKLGLAVALLPFALFAAFVATHLPFSTSTAEVFSFGPRYAAPLYPALFAAAACLLASPDVHRWVRWNVAAVCAASVFFALADTGRLVRLDRPFIARDFQGVTYTQHNLWGVDRVSMDAANHLIDAQQQGLVASEAVSGVHAILDRSFDDGYWSFLALAPPGAGEAEVQQRVEQALERPEAANPDYRRGVEWARLAALGLWPGPAVEGALP